MLKGFYQIPPPENEPVKTYAPGSPERALIKQALAEARAKHIDIPMHIGGKEIRTDILHEIHPPHDTAHLLGHYHQGDESHVRMAINSALKAKADWENLSWESRASVFLKAADLLAGPWRARMNAATMLCQSKNVYQAEIDSACELADFWRFNVHYMTQIYTTQPVSPKGFWNRMDYRPLEGFVYALTPFNFTAIAGNLPTAPAIMGNTVVWKCANSQIYSARVIMEILREAGLPDGVINLIYVSGPVAGKVIFSHPQFGGIHYTGSTEVFHQIWKDIATYLPSMRSFPRIVGETGGKDFVLAHPSANPLAVATALARGAFEFQGQKCSAASRAYLPKSLWSAIKERLCTDLDSFKMGGVENFGNFINAVIDKGAFTKITSYIDRAKADGIPIISGGTYDSSRGYFIRPTVLECTDPYYRTMTEEIFGPVLSIFVYNDADFEPIMKLIDESTPYALTGAVFAHDRKVIETATHALRNAAGNFYINDKPTGAIVAQQPFGGARGSGTNDKSGSIFNLLRWTSVRSIKENFVSPTDYRYPFLEDEE